jgi:hypothetical protein
MRLPSFRGRQSTTLPSRTKTLIAWTASISTATLKFKFGFTGKRAQMLIDGS